MKRSRVALFSGFIVITWWVATVITAQLRPDPPKWVSELPEQLHPQLRESYGSTQPEDRRGRCGATIYRLSIDQSDQFRRGGIAALPTGMKLDSGEFGAWKPTPVSEADFNSFIESKTSQVGLNCSHGSWEKEWHAAAITPGNLYTENGKVLVLIDMKAATSRPNGAMSVGLFYNR